MDDDLISLYVFGEEESDLHIEAEQNGGVIQYDKVKHHHHKDIPLVRSHSFLDVSYHVISCPWTLNASHVLPVVFF